MNKDNLSEMLFNRDEKIIKIIEEKDKEIDILTAESTEWEERTYHWQDKAEKYQIILDKIKELLKSKQNGICYKNGKEKQAYTFVLNFDEAREFIWKIEELLEEIE